MADRSVGGIVGYLRLDKSDWDVALTQAGAKADDLARKNPNIKVSATTGEALAQLEAVAVATGRLQDAQAKVSLSQSKYNDLQAVEGTSSTKLLAAKNALAKATRDEEIAQIRLASAYQSVDDKAQKAAADAAKVGDSANKSNAQISPLGLAIAALGPGIVPVGAAAVAAAGALGGMGSAGILAILGIRNAMAQGTDLGQQYTIVLGDLKSNLQQLEQTAAGNFLGSVQQAVGALDAQMPTLNAEIGQFSTMAGRIGGNVFTGVIAGLHTMQPLFLQFGTYLDQLALKFAAWAQGGGFQKFVDYTLANLPNVEATLNALVAAVGRLAIGFIPMGGLAVNALRLVSDAINALPIPVVKALVTAITAGYLAFQAWTAVSTVKTAIEGVTKAIIAYDTAQLISTGVTKEAAASQATLGGGLTGMVGKYGSLAGAIGLAATAAAAIVVANQLISAHMTEVSASATAASTALLKMGQDGQTSAAMMKAFGASGSDLGKVLDQTFKQSTLDKMKDFQYFGIGTPFTTATKEASNFFKSTDTGLTQMVQQGNAVDADNAFKVLAAAAAKSGITVDQLLSKLPGYKAALDQIAATTVTAAQAQSLLNDQSGVTANSMNAIANQFHLTSQQATAYATIVGLSADDLKNGIITNQEYANAVYGVQKAYDNATQTGDAFLKSLATFSASAGTAADKASLIGAALRASQGDLLSYSGAVAGGADATQQLIISFQQQTKDVSLGIKSFRDSELAAIDLTTGLINLSATGALPLTQQLQAMQTAGENAAKATYQHEVAIKGAGTAAADAATIFKTDTYDALVNNAQQLGLTSDQAKKLADQYFSMPADITTTVKSIGLNDVNSTLENIANLLASLTGAPHNVDVNLQVNSRGVPLSAVDATLNAAHNNAGSTAYATGGWVNGPGTSTSDSVMARLSRREFVMPADKAATYAPMLEAMRSGVPLPASPAGQSFQASYSTAAAPAVAQVTTYVVLDGEVVAQSVNEHNLWQGRR